MAVRVSASSDQGSARIRLQARDVMTSPVITVRSDTSVKDIAAMMLAHHISGLPVVSADGALVGIVTEGDLILKERYPRAETEGVLASLLHLGKASMGARKEEGLTAADLMTTPVITVGADTPLHAVANLMVRKQINRVPVLTAGRIVGIVSRADVLRAFARPDEELTKAVQDALLHEMWINTDAIRIEVKDGVVYLDGEVDRWSDAELAERWAMTVDGVIKVESHLTFRYNDRNLAAGI